MARGLLPEGLNACLLVKLQGAFWHILGQSDDLEALIYMTIVGGGGNGIFETWSRANPS